MCNLFSKGERKAILWSLFVFIVVIPIVLNYLLPIPTGLKIIGKPTEWLSFWASYLAAVGSFTVAMVSLWMNKRLHQQNERTINYIRWDKMADRYNKIEKFIVEEERLHSEWVLRSILSFIETHENSDIKLLLCKKAQDLFSCSLKLSRFLEQEKASDYTTETGRKINEYGCKLKDANTNIYNFFMDKLEKNHSKEEWKRCINTLLNDNSKLFDNLKNKRMDYLLAERNRILKFAEDNKLEVYL